MCSCTNSFSSVCVCVFVLISFTRITTQAAKNMSPRGVWGHLEAMKTNKSCGWNLTFIMTTHTKLLWKTISSNYVILNYHFTNTTQPLDIGYMHHFYPCLSSPCCTCPVAEESKRKWTITLYKMEHISSPTRSFCQVNFLSFLSVFTFSLRRRVQMQD